MDAMSAIGAMHEVKAASEESPIWVTASRASEAIAAPLPRLVPMRAPGLLRQDALRESLLPKIGQMRVVTRWLCWLWPSRGAPK